MATCDLGTVADMAEVGAVHEPGPCSRCDSAGSVCGGVCEVCLAGFGGSGAGP